MKFTNAFEGVKKLYTAEIIGIATAVLSLITSILGTAGKIPAAAVMLVIVGIASVVGFIIQLIGLNSAGKDEGNFKTALYVVIAGIIISILGTAIKSGFFSTVLTALEDLVNPIVTYLCIQGIISLAGKLDDEAMKKKGNDLFKIIITFYIIVFVLNIIVSILNNKAVTTVAGILGIIAAILSIVIYVKYIKYLKDARTMLA